MKLHLCEWEIPRPCEKEASHYIGQIVNGKDIRPTYLCDDHLKDFLEGLITQ